MQHSESRQRDFLTSVSHELRTPLAGISGQAQALADEMVPPAEQAEVGRSISGEAARLERLVSDLLDLARLGADNFRLDLARIDLTALVDRDGAGLADPLRRKRVSPWCCSSRRLRCVVNTDARRVRQVLDGLAENALRLLGTGSSRWCCTRLWTDGVRPSCRSGTAVRASRRRTTRWRSTRASLHERYRGRRPGGAGLGLALAHSLVGRLGGTIVASPAPEGGVAMTIRLPLRCGAAGPGAMAQDGRVTADLDALLATARVFAIPLVERFRGITVREGVLLQGPAGWAEFAPFRDYDDAECVPWLRRGRRIGDQCRGRNGFADADRGEHHGSGGVAGAGGRTGAGVGLPDREDQGRGPAGRRWPRTPIGSPPSGPRSGPTGRIRVDANGAWTVPQAVTAIEVLDAAAGGLEYVEQPCRSLAELAAGAAAGRHADRRRRIHPPGR